MTSISSFVTPDYKAFIKACKAVIEAAEKSKPTSMLRYAGTYANVGIQMAHAKGTAADLSTQASYILTNLGGWRGPVAQETKKTLQSFTKAYK